MVSVVGKFYSDFGPDDGFKRKNGICGEKAVRKFYSGFLLISYKYTGLIYLLCYKLAGLTRFVKHEQDTKNS